MSAAARIAKKLGGARKYPSGWWCRCPVHEDHTPSLVLNDGETRLLVHCKALCAPKAILAALAKRGLLDDKAYDQEKPAFRPRIPAAAADVATKARRIFDQARPLAGSLSERYLRARGLDPGLLAGNAVRHLPAWRDYQTSLVALLTGLVDADQVRGLQFTPLAADGSARTGDRKFLTGSQPSGAVIRLVADAEVTDRLGLAEGLESALAAMTMMKRADRMVLPCWSAINAGNLGGLPVVHGIERLTILADHDASGAGQKAADKLAQRWLAARREVFIALRPRAGSDWNQP